MAAEFGDAIRPHLAAVYQAAHDHVQSVLSQYPNEPHPNAAAIDAARPGAASVAAPAEAAPVAAAPARTKPVMAGSVNLGNLDTTPEAKAALAAHTTALPSLSDADARTQARAMNLTTAHLATITPGEVPTGVPSKVFGSAVRQLAVAKAEQAASADAAHQAAPTPQTLAAATQANLDLKTVVTHQEALAQAAGQSLQGHGMQASAFEGALAKAADHQQALAQTPKLADLSAPVAKSPRVTSPEAKGFGAGNTVFTTEARDAALARIAAAGRQVNSGIDPALFKDAVIVAGHYIEGGIRQYAPLAAQMRTHFPNATDGDLQRVYSTAKAEAAAGITAKQRTTGTTVLADRLAPRMGRHGVSDFINALPPVHLDKLLSGAPFTDAEARTVAQIYESHLPPSRPASPPMAAIKVLRNAVRDAKSGALGYDSAKAVVREELLKAVDEKKVPAVTKALAGVKDDDFKGLGNVFSRHYPAGWDDKLKSYIQSNYLSGPRTLGSNTLSHLLSAGVEDTLIRPVTAGLLHLSGNRGLEQGLSLPASGRAIKAGVKAIPDSLRMIKEGGPASQLRGIAPAYHTDQLPGGRLRPEAISHPALAPFRLAPRVHAAFFHAAGEGLNARGIEAAAAMKAQRLGGHPSQYAHDPDVLKAAQAHREEMLFQNPNRMATGLSHIGGDSPMMKGLMAPVLPFAHVMSNIVGRSAEMTGAGAVLGPVRGAYFKRTGRDMTGGKAPIKPEDVDAFKAGVARQTARGLVGGLGGGAAGYGLAQAGILNPPNKDARERGSVNVGNYKYDIARYAPVTTGPLLGALINHSVNHKPADYYSLLADNPYSSAANTVQDAEAALSGKSKKGATARLVADFASGLIPFSTLLSQLASTTDPSGRVRGKAGALDYLKSALPGLRETLPAGPHPQASNYKSTGPLSLLYPGNVTPRTGRR